MPENREALVVMKRFKFPVPSADGVKMVVREFRPGDFLPRQAWDLATARSRRSMSNTGFVRDPLSVEINSRTGNPVEIPISKPSVTVVMPPTKVMRRRPDGELYQKTIYGYDRKLMAQQAASSEPSSTPSEPPKRKRGRPRKGT